MDWDWKRVKAEYITTDKSSYRKLAEKYDIPLGTLQKRAKREKWPDLKRQSGDRTVAKTVAVIERKKADKIARINDIADKLLDKLERAVDELDIQLCRNVKKVKTIEYNNHARPDKPTKEVIRENENVTVIHTVIDRRGAQALASALANIKEVQMLKTELDIAEQEARIANLRRQSETDDNKNSDIEVVFSAGPEEWNE